MQLTLHLTEMYDPADPGELIEEVSPQISVTLDDAALIIDLGRPSKANQMIEGPRVWIERRPEGAWAILLHKDAREPQVTMIVNDGTGELTLETEKEGISQ
jgi:hypothetical protein